jgi:hypothetical protein
MADAELALSRSLLSPPSPESGMAWNCCWTSWLAVTWEWKPFACVGDVDGCGDEVRGDPTTPNGELGEKEEGGDGDCEKRETLPPSMRPSNVDSPPREGRFGSRVLEVRGRRGQKPNDRKQNDEQNKTNKQTNKSNST